MFGSNASPNPFGFPFKAPESKSMNSKPVSTFGQPFVSQNTSQLSFGSASFGNSTSSSSNFNGSSSNTIFGSAAVIKHADKGVGFGGKNPFKHPSTNSTTVFGQSIQGNTSFGKNTVTQFGTKTNQGNSFSDLGNKKSFKVAETGNTTIFGQPSASNVNGRKNSNTETTTDSISSNVFGASSRPGFRSPFKQNDSKTTFGNRTKSPTKLKSPPRSRKRSEKAIDESKEDSVKPQLPMGIPLSEAESYFKAIGQNSFIGSKVTKNDNPTISHKPRPKSTFHSLQTAGITEEPKTSSITLDTTKEQLENAKNLDGVCIDMCSLTEREFRIRVEELSAFEKIGVNTPTDLRFTVIKRFQRSSADHKLDIPEEVRPPGVLRETLLYIENNIMDREIYGIDERINPPRVPDLIDLYNYVWDRTRMIRKDLTLQNFRAGGRVHPIAMDIHERIARYHILSEHELIEHKNFVARLNMVELGQTLKSLNEFYDESIKSGDMSMRSPYESEFRGYFILCTLDNGGGLDVLKYVMGLEKSMRKTPRITFAMEIFLARKMNDYYKFFKLFRSSTFLESCLLHRYLPGVRANGLQAMNRSFRKQPFPVSELTELFCFEDNEECTRFCQHHGLEVEMDKEEKIAHIQFGGSFISERTLIEENAKWDIKKSRRFITTKNQGLPRGQLCRGITEYEQPLPRLSIAVKKLQDTERKQLYPTRPISNDPYTMFTEGNNVISHVHESKSVIKELFEKQKIIAIKKKEMEDRLHKLEQEKLEKKRREAALELEREAQKKKERELKEKLEGEKLLKLELEKQEELRQAALKAKKRAEEKARLQAEIERKEKIKAEEMRIKMEEERKKKELDLIKKQQEDRKKRMEEEKKIREHRELEMRMLKDVWNAEIAWKKVIEERNRLIEEKRLRRLRKQHLAILKFRFHSWLAMTQVLRDLRYQRSDSVLDISRELSIPTSYSKPHDVLTKLFNGSKDLPKFVRSRKRIVDQETLSEVSRLSICQDFPCSPLDLQNWHKVYAKMNYWKLNTKQTRKIWKLVILDFEGGKCVNWYKSLFGILDNQNQWKMHQFISPMRTLNLCSRVVKACAVDSNTFKGCESLLVPLVDDQQLPDHLHKLNNILSHHTTMDSLSIHVQLFSELSNSEISVDQLKFFADSSSIPVSTSVLDLNTTIMNKSKIKDLLVSLDLLYEKLVKKPILGSISFPEFVEEELFIALHYQGTHITPEKCVKLINDGLERTEKLLTGEHVSRLHWPPPEFLLDGIIDRSMNSWNSPTQLMQLRKTLRSLKMLSFPKAEETTWDYVLNANRRACMQYVSLITCDSDHSQLISSLRVDLHELFDAALSWIVPLEKYQPSSSFFDSKFSWRKVFELIMSTKIRILVQDEILYLPRSIIDQHELMYVDAKSNERMSIEVNASLRLNNAESKRRPIQAVSTSIPSKRRRQIHDVACLKNTRDAGSELVSDTLTEVFSMESADSSAFSKELESELSVCPIAYSKFSRYKNLT